MLKRTLGSIVVAVGLAVAVTACGTAAANGGAGAGSASAPSSASSTPRAGRQFQGPPGITGAVVSVNGSTITVQDARQSGTTTVQLSDATQVFKQVSGTLASLPVGESITAVGTQSGDVFTATQVRVGMQQAGGFGNRTGGGQGAQPSGTPRAGGNGNGGQRQGGGGNGGSGQGNQGNQANGGGSRLFGTVEQAGADALTVKLQDGTTTQVRLAADGQVAQEVAGTAADVVAGARVVVTGDQQSGTLQATRIQVMPATAQP